MGIKQKISLIITSVVVVGAVAGAIIYSSRPTPKQANAKNLEKAEMVQADANAAETSKDAPKVEAENDAEDKKGKNTEQATVNSNNSIASNSSSQSASNTNNAGPVSSSNGSSTGSSSGRPSIGNSSSNGEGGATTAPKPSYIAGMDENMTSQLNSRSSINSYGMRKHAGMFNDLARKVASGSLSSGPAKSQIEGLAHWNDDYKGQQAEYEILSARVVCYTTSATTAQGIDVYAMKNGYRVAGNYTYNAVYRNSDGTYTVCRVAVSFGVSQ